MVRSVLHVKHKNPVRRLTIVTGMIDVLPKPFTKEGLLNMLEKYLGALMANEPGVAPVHTHGYDPSMGSGSYGIHPQLPQTTYETPQGIPLGQGNRLGDS